MIGSLRIWLISSFSAILLICTIAIWLFANAINTSKKLEEYYFNLKNTRILLLETNRLKENILLEEFNDSSFYNRTISTPEKKIKEYNSEIKKQIALLKSSSITINNNLLGKIEKIESYLNDYNSIYNELIYLYKLKGFKDYGLEGKLRNYAHAIFDFNNKSIQYYCLLLRKHEKDFLLRKDIAYVNSYSLVIKELLEFINTQKSITTKNKKLLTSQIYFYNTYFKLLARIESKIGIKGKNGYLNKSNLLFDNMANMIKTIDDDLKTVEATHKKNLNRNSFIVVVILITFLIATIIILTQIITKSVKSISFSFSNYVNSGFNYDVIQYKKSKIKEFNAIFLSFVSMAKEINIFTNFFKEKVHERTLAVNQQRDEILWQQLQIENQYKDLLTKNEELNEQKKLLSLKNNDTQQSLRYAKRIQKAILPSSSKFKEYFADSFIFSKAKNVISGDFYLIYKHSAKSEDSTNQELVNFIASDCTGHGVPGAIMSVLGINTINKIIKELKNSDPGNILNLLDKDIHQVLSHGKKAQDIVADGMDIAVFSFNPQTYVLEYSIAKFSHFLVRNGEIIPLVIQKATIGYSFFNNNVKSFSTSCLQLNPGDCLYLFSDGFSDQFGGPLNKKYKKHNIRTLIQKIHAHPMADQKLFFKKEFKNWKKTNKQTDDVLVMGIRF